MRFQGKHGKMNTSTYIVLSLISAHQNLDVSQQQVQHHETHTRNKQMDYEPGHGESEDTVLFVQQNNQKAHGLGTPGCGNEYMVYM